MLKTSQFVRLNPEGEAMKARYAVQVILIGGLSAVMAMISGGCAVTKHSPHLPETERSQIRKVVVVPSSFVPREDFVMLKKAKQQPSGAPVLNATTDNGTTEAEPIGSGDSKVDEGWKQVAEAAWSEGWQVPSGVGIATAVLVSPLLGAVVGVATNAPIGLRMGAEEKAKTDAVIAQAYSGQDVQKNAARFIVETGRRLTGIEFLLTDGYGPVNNQEKPDYRSLGRSGADTVLEMSLRDIGFVAGSGSDPLTALFMLADVRVVEVANGSVVYMDTTTYVSRKRHLSEWLADGGRALRTELQNGQINTAEWIVDKLFLVEEIKPVSMWLPTTICMFDIYSPKTPSMQFHNPHLLSTPQIDTLRPVFLWEAFPREVDRKADSTGMLSKVTDITYDLKIWKVQDGYPQEVAYEKIGFSPILKTVEKKVLDPSQPASGPTYKTVSVAAAEYGLEKQLEPSTVYFWSIRARFKFSGQTRVTKWAYSRVPFPPSIPDPCNSDHIDVMHFYRFKTPDL
jgi:hypothetical protein